VQSDEADLRPWTEVGGTIVQIPNSKLGRIDVGHLRDQLEEQSKSDRPLIGYFSASSEIRTLMKGVENVDSVTWNPHKLMGSIQQCSVFLVKKKGVLASANKMSASYLFQQDKIYDVKYDTGDKTIQCGRHVDAFKCWLMWRSKGDSGFEAQIDTLWSLADLLHKEVVRRDNFEMVMDSPECTNVCFWYIPKSLQHMDRKCAEFKEKLHAIAPQIKAGMMLNGSMMMSYQPLDDYCNFFRMVFCTQATREEDVIFLCDEIERIGKDL
jgi:glutamate decarboxylase